METSEPEEKGQHKFDGILICSMGLNGDTKVQSFENFSFSGSSRHFFPQILPKNIQKWNLDFTNLNY